MMYWRVCFAHAAPRTAAKICDGCEQHATVLLLPRGAHLEARCENLQQQSWIAPELTRGLYGQENDAEVFRRVADRLKAAGLSHVYICLLKKPQRYGYGGLETIPQKLLLAASANGSESVAYPSGNMPVIDAQRPFSSLPGLSGGELTHVVQLLLG